MQPGFAARLFECIMPPMCVDFSFEIIETNTYHNIHASRDKFAINSKAVVCQDVELKGDITIGPGTNTRCPH